MEITKHLEQPKLMRLQTTTQLNGRIQMATAFDNQASGATQVDANDPNEWNDLDGDGSGRQRR